MPHYYFDGKKVDYKYVIDPTGVIQGIAENVRHVGTNTILGESYTNLTKAKARILKEWNMAFYRENNPVFDARRELFLTNLENELLPYRQRDDSHGSQAYRFHELIRANNILKHIIEDLNGIDEGNERISIRNETNQRSGLVVRYDYSGFRWMKNRSYRDNTVSTPALEADRLIEYEAAMLEAEREAAYQATHQDTRQAAREAAREPVDDGETLDDFIQRVSNMDINELQRNLGLPETETEEYFTATDEPDDEATAALAYAP